MYIAVATVQIVFKRLQSLEYEPNNMAPSSHVKLFLLKFKVKLK